jgi:hypothetical protein
MTRYRNLPLALFLAFLVLGLTTPAVPAADGPKDASDRAAAVKFLKEQVVGKTLASALITSKTDDGKVEGSYEDRATISNFTESADGFEFDVVTESRETLYDLDAAGKRVMPGKDISGVRVWHVQVLERKSSHKLVGLDRLVSSTIKEDPYAGAFSTVQMEMKDGKLVIKETQGNYADFVAAKGGRNPVAADSVTTLWVEGGKLQARIEQTTFDVDPVTLKRTPTNDKFPPAVTKELEGK